MSDGWPGYQGLEQHGFPHIATPLHGDSEAAHRLFPWVHITLSNLKRFLLGTHHKVEAQDAPNKWSRWKSWSSGQRPSLCKCSGALAPENRPSTSSEFP